MKQDVVANFWIKKNYITFVHIYLQHETIYIYIYITPFDIVLQIIVFI
jgi:hypothetical protein